MDRKKAEFQKKDEEKEVKTYDIPVPVEGEEDRVLKELTQLRESASKQDESIQTYMEQIRRLQADFENWRRRVEREKLSLVENASSALAGKLLPVLDGFERALQAPVNSKTDPAFVEGMSLIFRQLQEILKEEGLTPIEVVDELFDPKLHEAVAYEERESGEDHRVIEEARKGYLFKSQVLRPALVKVLKVSRPASADSDHKEIE